MPGRNTGSFLSGAGVEEELHTCADCGYASSKKKHFKRNGEEALTCATDHYTDKAGNMKRARNPYAARR